MAERAGLFGRIADAVEERTGWTALPRERLDRLSEAADSWHIFREEAEDLAYHALDYLGGRPQEMRPERRARLSQRSRHALREDPLAGAESMLLSNFAFGRGVSRPQAVDETVQEVIDDAWEDPINAEKLTSFAAQRHRSSELLTQANLYPVAFVGDGRVRLGFLDADVVTDVVCDPEDDELPLYYVSRKRRVEWDYENDRYAVSDEMKEGGLPKLLYWPHWRHVEDLRAEAEEGDGQPPPGPPADKLGDGLCLHVRINRIGRSQFGTPPWARSLRFFSAMNALTEAHVQMAQAASTWVAKRTVKGGPRAVLEQANSVLSQAGELAASRFRTTSSETTEGYPHVEQERAAQVPPLPGSLWTENESHKLEALQLSSGASQAAQTAQIVRAPIAAAAGFGQHYMGDASNANLATATSLELPALMNVQAWQETFEGLFRWFVDLVIQEAARAGRLGGRTEIRLAAEDADPVGRLPLSALRLSESEERRELERRTGKDLSDTFEMPYPGRRNLPDVTSTVVQIAASYDPAGMNIPLRRQLLYFFARDGLQVDDPARFVDDAVPEDLEALPGAGAMPPGTEPGTEPGAVGPGTAGGTSGGTTPTDEQPQNKNARGPRSRPSTGDMGEAFLAPELSAPLESMEGELDRLWRQVVEDPAVSAALAASGSSNGGAGAAAPPA